MTMPRSALLVISMMFLLIVVQLRSGSCSWLNADAPTPAKWTLQEQGSPNTSATRQMRSGTAGRRASEGYPVGTRGGYKSMHRLYNQCSQRFVSLTVASKGRKGVHAMGRNPTSFSTSLAFVTDVKPYIRIYSPGVRQRRGQPLALCFTRKGHLIVRKGRGKSRRHNQCKFEEDYADPNKQYMILKSAYNPTWLVGFNKKGKPLKGDKYLERPGLKRCYYFIKNHDDRQPKSKISRAWYG